LYICWICIEPCWGLLPYVGSATKRVHETRDVIWLKHMYYTKPNTGTEFIAMPIVIQDHKAPSVGAAGPVHFNNPTIKIGERDTQLNEVDTNQATEPN